MPYVVLISWNEHMGRTRSSSSIVRNGNQIDSEYPYRKNVYDPVLKDYIELGPVTAWMLSELYPWLYRYGYNTVSVADRPDFPPGLIPALHLFHRLWQVMSNRQVTGFINAIRTASSQVINPKTGNPMQLYYSPRTSEEGIDHAVVHPS